MQVMIEIYSGREPYKLKYPLGMFISIDKLAPFY